MLRYCKRCGEIFKATGKCSRICSNCTKSTGGWNLRNAKTLNLTEKAGDF